MCAGLDMEWVSPLAVSRVKSTGPLTGPTTQRKSLVNRHILVPEYEVYDWPT